MTRIRSIALAAALTLGFAGAAVAQVQPGLSGTPGRGNSNTVTTGPGGGAVSNGQMAEPGTAMRSRKSMRSRKATRSRRSSGRSM